MITGWTGLARWEFEFHFPGSLASTFLALSRCQCQHPLTSKHGTCKTANARFWPWRSGQGSSNLERCSFVTSDACPGRIRHPSSFNIDISMSMSISIQCWREYVAVEVNPHTNRHLFNGLRAPIWPLPCINLSTVRSVSIYHP